MYVITYLVFPTLSDCITIQIRQSIYNCWFKLLHSVKDKISLINALYIRLIAHQPLFSNSYHTVTVSVAFIVFYQAFKHELIELTLAS